MNNDSKKPIIIVVAVLVIVVAIFFVRKSLTSTGAVNSGAVQEEVKKATSNAESAQPVNDSGAGGQPAGAMLPGGKGKH